MSLGVFLLTCSKIECSPSYFEGTSIFFINALWMLILHIQVKHWSKFLLASCTGKRSTASNKLLSFNRFALKPSQYYKRLFSVDCLCLLLQKETTCDHLRQQIIKTHTYIHPQDNTEARGTAGHNSPARLSRGRKLNYYNNLTRLQAHTQRQGHISGRNLT